MSHISSLGSTPMQLVCSFTGELDGVSWLLSSKQVLFRAITFIRFSDLHWTRLSRLFQWALKSCTLINCPIFLASVSGDLQKPLTSIREFPVLTGLTLGQRPRAKLLPVPNSQLLVRYKSNKHKATMKAREDINSTELRPSPALTSYVTATPYLSIPILSDTCGLAQAGV